MGGSDIRRIGGAPCRARIKRSRCTIDTVGVACCADKSGRRRTPYTYSVPCHARRTGIRHTADTDGDTCHVCRTRNHCTADIAGAVCRARKRLCHHRVCKNRAPSHVHISSQCAASSECAVSQGVVLAALLQLTNSPYDELHFGRGSRRAQLSFVSNKECVILGPSRTCGQ